MNTRSAKMRRNNAYSRTSALYTLDALDSLPDNSSKGHDEDMGKRTVSVTVKMSAEDYTLLAKAADAIWPKAVLTRSSIVLGLARIGAETMLKETKKK